MPETTYDPMGLEAVGIPRWQGLKEPQKFEGIHIVHAAATESANRGISLGTVFTTSSSPFYLYQHDYYCIFRNCGGFLIRSGRAIVIGI
jgi:hypothetical protein